ncbi:MAG: PASTA domain-containing protein, partial [Candidatus Elarobacter sp.]
AASETVLQDHVVSQDPAAGAMLASSALVALVVSNGLPPVQVPEIQEYSAADAQRALQNAKLKSKIVGKFDPAAPAGQVLQVNPPVNTSVREGDTVVLTISKGPQPVTVPNFVKLSVDDARSKARAAGLTLIVQQTQSDTIPTNVIASQDPQPDVSVKPQTAVTVVVSTGPSSVIVPDVSNKDLDSAQAALHDAGFDVELTYSVESANPTGHISGQAPAAGTKSKKGARVRILLSVSGNIPDVTGMPLEQAKKMLRSSGYVVGNVNYSGDSSLEDGSVLRTEPEANSNTAPGESVNITVMQAGSGDKAQP